MLWQGLGLAPGHEEDIYSGRAKAFGLLAGLIFLNHYMESYDHGHFCETLLHCFCNNMGVLTHVTDLLKPSTLHPNKTTNDDQDVYLAISTLVLQCSLLQLSFLHMKGHQDKDPNRPLMIIKQLKIDCNHCAKAYT